MYNIDVVVYIGGIFMSKLISKYWKKIIWIITFVLIVININVKILNTVSLQKQLQYLSDEAVTQKAQEELNK